MIQLDLTKFDTVVVNSSDKQLISDRISNLVIQENASSWQQSWLIHWNKVNTSIGQRRFGSPHVGEETLSEGVSFRTPSLSVKKILSPPANENSTSLQKKHISSKQLEL